MPSFEVAHINEQGVNLIIIPLNSSFDYKTPFQQKEIAAELHVRANRAGLRGTVVPVWEDYMGRFCFLAPYNWHAFFESINMDFVVRNINHRLYWY